jgi:hypothetical protein
MFQKLLAIGFLIAVTFSTASSQDINEIIQKAKSLCKQSEIKTLYVETQSKMMGMDMGMKQWKKGPNTRVDNTFMGQNISVVITDKEGWMNQNGTITELPESQLETTRHQLKQQDPTRTCHFDEEGLTFELIGKEKVNGKVCYNIQMKDKDGNTSNIYLEQNTLEAQKLSSKQPDMSGEMKNFEMVFSEWGTFSGFRFPKKIEIFMDDQSIGTMENTVVKVNEPIDDSVFKK